MCSRHQDLSTQAAAPNGASGEAELAIELQTRTALLLATTSATKSANTGHPASVTPKKRPPVNAPLADGSVRGVPPPGSMRLLSRISSGQDGLQGPTRNSCCERTWPSDVNASQPAKQPRRARRDQDVIDQGATAGIACPQQTEMVDLSRRMPRPRLRPYPPRPLHDQLPGISGFPAGPKKSPAGEARARTLSYPLNHSRMLGRQPVTAL